MVFLDKFQEEFIFRHQEGEHWVGNVHALSRDWECVSFTLANEKYLLTFTMPPYLVGQGFYREMLYKTVNGGYFIPKREHRKLHLWKLDQKRNFHQMQNLSSSLVETFSDTLMDAVLLYLREYPNTNQFFYEAEAFLGNFIQFQVAQRSLAARGMVMETFDEIEPPFYGFRIQHNDAK